MQNTIGPPSKVPIVFYSLNSILKLRIQHLLWDLVNLLIVTAVKSRANYTQPYDMQWHRTHITIPKGRNGGTVRKYWTKERVQHSRTTPNPLTSSLKWKGLYLVLPFKVCCLQDSSLLNTHTWVRFWRNSLSHIWSHYLNFHMSNCNYHGLRTHHTKTYMCVVCASSCAFIYTHAQRYIIDDIKINMN